MKCVRCGKPLNKAALTIPSKTGPLAWGPKCAKSVQVVPTRTAHRVVKHVERAAEVDPNQCDLFAGLAA